MCTTSLTAELDHSKLSLRLWALGAWASFEQIYQWINLFLQLPTAMVMTH